MVKINYRNLAKRIVSILEEKKGKDIIMLDVRKVSDSMEYLIIASGSSDVHIKALVNTVEEEAGVPIYKKEISSRPTWAVLDYGNVMVHVFLAEARQFFSLEKLFSAGKIIELSEKRTKKNDKRSKKDN
ncbi:MAG: Ribosomal silencing factor RsfS [Elusimicrobia bacterium ADurb.Bin231]|nr:MAG: Ribosomal silencing factor RsfS [Elusimicrobia bacterium ADurb.Bin231]